MHTLINHEEKDKRSLSDSVEEAHLRGSTENPEDPEQRDKKSLMEEANRIVNWRTEKILNIVEIYSSPMRKAFLEYFTKSKDIYFEMILMIFQRTNQRREQIPIQMILMTK